MAARGSHFFKFHKFLNGFTFPNKFAFMYPEPAIKLAIVAEMFSRVFVKILQVSRFDSVLATRLVLPENICGNLIFSQFYKIPDFLISFLRKKKVSSL